MNIAYLIYQAERPRTAAEQRADAVRAGELAKAVSRVLHRRRHATEASLASPAPAARPTLTLVRDSAVSPAHATCTCEARTAS
jgi:hypothetical protein